MNPNADYEAQNLLVYANVIVGGEEAAFRMVDCKDCTVANDTWISTNPKAWLRILAIGFGDASGCGAKKLGFSQLKVVNNVFYSTTPPAYGIASNALPRRLLDPHAECLVRRRRRCMAVGSDIPFTGEPSSLYQDPMLTAPPTDLRPTATSPLVGAGIATPGVDGNFAGACSTSGLRTSELSSRQKLHVGAAQAPEAVEHVGRTETGRERERSVQHVRERHRPGRRLDRPYVFTGTQTRPEGAQTTMENSTSTITPATAFHTGPWKSPLEVAGTTSAVGLPLDASAATKMPQSQMWAKSKMPCTTTFTVT